MKKKLFISVIALILCGVFIFTACAPLSDGESLKEKIEGWFDKKDDKSDSDDTTETPQSSGNVTTDTHDSTKDPSVETDENGVPIFTNKSENFVCSYVSHNNGTQDVYVFYVGFTGLNEDDTYRVYWDADIALLVDGTVSRYRSANDSYAMFYFYPSDPSYYYLHGVTTSATAFDNMCFSGSLDIPTEADGAFYFGFWMVSVDTSESELSTISSSIRDSITVRVYEA